jgi:hypothetical protein
VLKVQLFRPFSSFQSHVQLLFFLSLLFGPPWSLSNSSWSNTIEEHPETIPQNFLKSASFSCLVKLPTFVTFVVTGASDKGLKFPSELIYKSEKGWSIIGGNRRKDLGYFFIQYVLFPCEFNVSAFSECSVPAVWFPPPPTRAGYTPALAQSRLEERYSFMYRRPTLCTLHIAVDFLKSLKIAVVWGGKGGYWDIVHILYPCRW